MATNYQLPAPPPSVAGDGATSITPTDPKITGAHPGQYAPPELQGVEQPAREQQPLTETMSLAQFAQLSAAQQISLRRFGRRTRPIASDVTLAAAAAAVLAQNSPDRVSLSIVNTGQANSGTVTAVGNKTVAQGDLLDANGGSLSSSALEDGEFVTREFWGISTSGTTMHIEEVIAYGPLVALPAGVTPL